MSVVVIGLNHRTAPLDLLERTAVDDARLPKVLHDLCTRTNLSEAVVLSTCNRTEVSGVRSSCAATVRNSSRRRTASRASTYSLAARFCAPSASKRAARSRTSSSTRSSSARLRSSMSVSVPSQATISPSRLRSGNARRRCQR